MPKMKKRKAEAYRGSRRQRKEEMKRRRRRKGMREKKRKREIGKTKMTKIIQEEKS